MDNETLKQYRGELITQIEIRDRLVNLQDAAYMRQEAEERREEAECRRDEQLRRIEEMLARIVQMIYDWQTDDAEQRQEVVAVDMQQEMKRWN